MKCPKCGQKKTFRTAMWELSNEWAYIRITEGGGWDLEDSKHTECQFSGVYPDGETRCVECSFEGPTKLFNDGQDDLNFESEPTAGLNNLPKWKKLILRGIGIHL